MNGKEQTKISLQSILAVLVAIAASAGLILTWNISDSTESTPTAEYTQTFTQTILPTVATFTRTPTQTTVPLRTNTPQNGIFQTATAAQATRDAGALCDYIAIRPMPIQNCIGGGCSVIGEVPVNGRFFLLDSEERTYGGNVWYNITSIADYLTNDAYDSGYVPRYDLDKDDNVINSAYFVPTMNCEFAPTPTPEILPTPDNHTWLLKSNITSLNVRRAFSDGRCIDTNGNVGASLGKLTYQTVSHRQLILSAAVYIVGNFEQQYRVIEGAVSSAFPQSYIGACVSTGSKTVEYMTPS